jgi:phage terminase small subunit
MALPIRQNHRLTDKQEAFCRFYIVAFNAAHSARLAGYSLKTAPRIGATLIHNRSIIARVQELQRERVERTRMDADAVLNRLAEELAADVNDLFEEDGRIKPTNQWPMAWRRGLVAGVKVNELWEVDEKTGKKRPVGVTKELVFSDRTKRIELLGRHINVQAFKEKVQLGVDDPLRRLFEQIAGQSVRPAIELQRNPDPDQPSEPVARPGLPYSTPPEGQK